MFNCKFIKLKHLNSNNRWKYRYQQNSRLLKLKNRIIIHLEDKEFSYKVRWTRKHKKEYSIKEHKEIHPRKNGHSMFRLLTVGTENNYKI